MRKTIVLIISIVFLVSNSIQASLFAPKYNPYSFGPQGRAVADLKDFGKPKQMANILSGRPVVATKQDGSRVFYSSDGKLCLSVKQNGEMTFSLKGHSRTLDKFGNLKSESKTLKGNIQEIRNEFGEIQSFNKLNGDGNVVASYDEDKNKTMVYQYGEFDKTLKYSINLMNGQKTAYDDYGRAMAVYDMDGYILSSYQYEDISYESAGDRKTLLTVENKDKGEYRLLTMRTYLNELEGGVDSDMNIKYYKTYSTTYYNDKGLVTHVDNPKGITTTVYHYEKDTKNNIVLQYVLDTTNKHKTYYENNKQMYVKDENDFIITRYFWDGSKYLFSSQVDEKGDLTIVDKKGLTVYNNIFYNNDGTISMICDDRGTKIIKKFFYREGSDGSNVLDYVENMEDGSKTYVDDNGYPTVTVNYKGEVIIDYGYNGSQKIYEFDRMNGTTKWFDGKDNILYESLGNVIRSKNIYSDGQLIGKWTIKRSESTTEDTDFYETIYDLAIYVNEREEFHVNVDEEPTVDTVRSIIAWYMKIGPVKLREDFLNEKGIVEVTATNTDISDSTNK